MDLHHNAYSSDPPYEVIEAFGVSAIEAVRESLSEFGLTVVEEAPLYFKAEIRA